MSYLIQNFSYPYYTNRAGLRAYALLAVRNIALLYLMLTTPHPVITTDYYKVKHIPSTLKLVSKRFEGLAKVTLHRGKYFRYMPLGANFSRSAYFNCLQTLERKLYKDPTNVPSLQFTGSAVTYPYATGTYVVIMPIAGATHNYALIAFFHQILRVWNTTPGYARIPTHYICVQNEILFVTLLNIYYFKTYNL